MFMRSSFILSFSLIFFSKLLFAGVNDSITIHFKLINNNKFFTGTVFQYGIEKKNILEFEIKDNAFSFSLPPSTVPGVYQLQFDSAQEKKHVDIIVNGTEKSIVFDVNIYGTYVEPVFAVSIENINWYSYLQKSKKSIERLNGLFGYLSNFHTKSNRVDRSVMQIYQNERDKYYKLFNDFVKINSNSWCGLMVLNKPYYFSNLRKPPVARDFIRKNYYWEGIDTNNSKLINTPIYKELIDLYFDKYYLNPIETYTSTQKEYNLKKGIDIVIEKFSYSSYSREFVTSYLKDFFKRLEMHDMISYVNQKEIF